MAYKLLDLYSGAGGASKGYQDAGFHVTGVDHLPQPRYVGDDFVQDDALDFLSRNHWQFDAIHASPPRNRPDLVSKIGAWLDFYNKLYVIEDGRRSSLVLCGSMFDLDLYRHRGFHTNFKVKTPKHPFHTRSAVHPDEWKPGLVMSVVGNCSPIEHARTIMQCPWMLREELAEATPPAYTAYIGDVLRRRLDRIARTRAGLGNPAVGDMTSVA